MANQKIVTDEALSAFASDVKAAIANVSSPLVYKGTLGVGGTISTLPAASASNKGYAYVVITAGTYQGVVCAVGNVIASNGTAWNRIPQANSAETLPITSGSAVNTKEYIDDKTTLTNTASGSLVHITDGGDNVPVKSLASEIVAVQSGSGTPSPSNPRAISGFDSGVVSVCGKNLANFTDGYGISTSGEIVSNAKRTSTVNPIKVDNTKTYVFTFTGSNIVGAYAVWNNNTLVRRITGFGGGAIDISGGNLVYLSCYNSGESASTPPTTKADCTPQLEQNTTATTYEAYNGNTYTFTFGQTVYGGHFDNKGNLVLTHKVVDLGSLNWGDDALHISGNVSDMLSGNYASDLSSYSCEQFVAKNRYVGWVSLVDGEFGINGQTIRCKWSPSTTGASFKTLVTGCKFVYPLATPITLSITSQDIPTLLGENNIFSNCGDVEVDYYTSKSNDVLDFINSEIGKKNGTNIPIEENSQDSIKDYVDDEISSTKDYVDNGLNDKVAYKSDEVVYSNYIAGAYISGSGNYVEFCIPINTKATSGTITNLGTTLNVFIGNTRLTNEVTLTDSSIVAIKDGYAQIELKLNSTQTANSVATVSLDGFTVNFA